MKKTLLIALILSILFYSCSAIQPATKRDCRGVKHQRQAGGFYL